MKRFLQQFILMMLMAVVIGVTFAFVFDRLQPEQVVVQAQPTETTVPSSPSTGVSLSSDELQVIDIVESLKHAIVSINTSGLIRGQEQLIGRGSGVAFDEDKDHIYIMTNDHVVSDGSSFTIDLVDGQQFKVELVAHDQDTEIAVMSVLKSDLGQAKLELAPLGKSADLVVGETVLAIGNALGYGQSVTKGIVSAMDRQLEGYRGNYAYKMIQTDAPINPGNSGGALVNSRGEVVGINTIKIVDASVDGVGFAIPIEPAHQIALDLKELGYLPKTYIGVASQFVDPNYLTQNDLPLGTIVFSVTPGSPAEQAGIQREDIIVKINDDPTPDPSILGYVVRSHQPGDEVTVTIYRAGEMMDIKVTLAQSTQ